MLKINNLTKIYKPKKGAPVLALDNVSFVLPETGMVFLLGKSGSGKSTLLNLIGGLDSYTSGEIVIKGKSSKEFKGSDFDSYRNTFIGFIFQEFNILEDYSVGKNIAIALELQQKKADRTAVEQIMEQVDLDKLHYDRNTNELSGGQKQRVAIARALIKNPDILMADEPTGALDSKTGEQVFETLKKLSKEKLVIVVSHDRESAERYADRIIELADGVIIEDKVAKDGTFFPTVKENINVKEYASDDFKLVKSKLNIRDSIVMGIAGLKQKKLRLFFTILLSVFAFLLFGLSATGALFDQYKSEINTARDNGQKTMIITSVTTEGENFYNQYLGAGFSQENIDEIERLTGNTVLRQAFRDRYLYGSPKLPFGNNLARQPDSAYYVTELKNFLKMDSENSANLIAVANGSYLPNEGDSTKIAISDFVADTFVACDLIKGDTVKEINSYEDLLGEKIVIEFDYNRTIELEISGVYKTDVDKEMYAHYKDKEKITSIDGLVLDARDELIISMGFVCKDFAIPKNPGKYNNWDYKLGEQQVKILYSMGKANKFDKDDVYLGGRELSSLKDDEIIINPLLFGAKDYKLNSDDAIKRCFDEASEQEKIMNFYQNDILVGKYTVAGVALSETISSAIYVTDNTYDAMEKIQEERTDITLEMKTRMAAKNVDKYDPFQTNPSYEHSVWRASDYDLSTLAIYWGKNAVPKTHLEDNEIIISKKTIIQKEFTSDVQFQNKFDEIDKDALFGKTMGIYNQENYISHLVEGKEVKIVGMYMGDKSIYIAEDKVYEYMDKLVNRPISIMVNLNDNWNKNQQVFDYLESLEERDGVIISQFKINTTATQLLDEASSYTDFFMEILLYASLVFSLFAGLLLMNFIAVSIQNKKKEIGILRAIGAKSTDVFKIFVTESLIIGAINFLLSYVAVIIACVVINNIFSIAFLIPGIIPALLIAAVSFGVATLSTLIPTYKIAKKKPIDAINNR